jgi:hypothetical protein
MHHAHTLATHPRTIAGAILAGYLLLAASAVRAADAHQAVKAQPGEMVLLRDVAARPAIRQAPPGMALIVDPSPRPELARALGTGELSGEFSEAEYASLDASPAGMQNGHRTTIERMTDQALGSNLGSMGSSHHGVAGNGISNVIAGPLGSLGSATQGIGHQVQGTFSQLPVLIPAPTGGH